METTRHFTATVYMVNDGATALHRHPKLGIRIPPGGHIDRDELPHEAALRETREETGLDPTLVDETRQVGSPNGETLPAPRHTMLYDIDVSEDGTVAHQHIDSVFFAAVDSRDIDPTGDGEAGSERWAWYTPEDLRASELERDTVEIGIEAIESVESAEATEPAG